MKHGSKSPQRFCSFGHIFQFDLGAIFCWGILVGLFVFLFDPTLKKVLQIITLFMYASFSHTKISELQFAFGSLFLHVGLLHIFG